MQAIADLCTIDSFARMCGEIDRFCSAWRSTSPRFPIVRPESRRRVDCRQRAGDMRMDRASPPRAYFQQNRWSAALSLRCCLNRATFSGFARYSRSFATFAFRPANVFWRFWARSPGRAGTCGRNSAL